MRVFIDKTREKKMKGFSDSFAELYTDLQAEESRCNGCNHQYNVSIVYCRNCEIYGNIIKLENNIRDKLRQ